MVVYGVYRNGGEGEEAYHELDECFNTRSQAESYRQKLEDAEEEARSLMALCKCCTGTNRDCPMWVEPFDDSNECLNYYEYSLHDQETYTIEEMEFEE